MWKYLLDAQVPRFRFVVYILNDVQAGPARRMVGQTILGLFTGTFGSSELVPNIYGMWNPSKIF